MKKPGQNSKIVNNLDVKMHSIYSLYSLFPLILEIYKSSFYSFAFNYLFRCFSAVCIWFGEAI